MWRAARWVDWNKLWRVHGDGRDRLTRDIFDAVVAMSGYGNWPDLRDEVELRHLKLLEHELGP